MLLRKGLIVLSILLGILLIATSCGVTEVDKTKELKPVEVREYQGEKLSSITEFQQNAIKGPQFINKEDYRLKVTGLVQSQRSYTYDEVISRDLYKKVVTLNCVEGWSVTILWEGILVRDLINEAGLMPNTKVVIFRAYDGYSTSFPLDYIMTRDMLMAYKINDVTIPPERGFPFQLVAESKWGYKWIKWITEIELSDNTSYRGYWESRGYSDSGDLDKGFYEH
jgi:DMSO/TMAO reductase YedYZ molybdopterin-dependent catalytic subunit